MTSSDVHNQLGWSNSLHNGVELQGKMPICLPLPIELQISSEVRRPQDLSCDKNCTALCKERTKRCVGC